MNIAVLSDLHLDMNSNFVGEDLLPILIETFVEKQPDLIVIAGDLSDHVTSTITMLDEIEKHVKVKILFIPGNHDIWVRNNESSWDSYKMFEKHPSSIINKPFVVNNEYVIIGDMGWFDYSLAAESSSMYEILSEKEDWGDHKYTNWNMDDGELNQVMLNQLEEQLRLNKDKEVIFVTHFVPYKEYVIRSNEYMNWDVYNAFMGSVRMGELINRYANIKYAIFGHTHERYPLYKDEQKTIICNPLGYIGERNVETFKQELEKSITIINI
ncbi:metallophosphoesterase [Bacillus massiliigorillae]|uniref:metallophosphoesterase n=1 Tax=Bacillus massiliigorillae TaxID=1243664 RepID=UPI00039BC4C8|nr:metallophosphoesterase [Bacillus massiliigorillae]